MLTFPREIVPSLLSIPHPTPSPGPRANSLFFLLPQDPESPALPPPGAVPLSAVGTCHTLGPPSTAFTTGERRASAYRLSGIVQRGVLYTSSVRPTRVPQNTLRRGPAWGRAQWGQVDSAQCKPPPSNSSPGSAPLLVVMVLDTSQASSQLTIASRAARWLRGTRVG